MSDSDKIRVLVIPPGQPSELRMIPTGLTAMQEIVGGHIERVDLPSAGESGLDMWCNEEGLLQGLPFNLLATSLVRAQYPGYEAYIVGTVFLSGSAGPDTVGLTDADLEALGVEA